MKRILSIFAVAAIAFTFSACDLLDDLSKDRDTDSEIMIPDDSPSDDDSGKDNNDGGSTDGSGDNPGGGNDGSGDNPGGGNDDNGGNTGDNTGDNNGDGNGDGNGDNTGDNNDEGNTGDNTGSDNGDRSKYEQYNHSFTQGDAIYYGVYYEGQPSDVCNWWIELADSNYSLEDYTGEGYNVILEFFCKGTTPAAGTYTIDAFDTNPFSHLSLLYGFTDEYEEDGETIQYPAGTWLYKGNEPIAGATAGSMTIAVSGSKYTVTYTIHDDDYEITFKGSYTGELPIYDGTQSYNAAAQQKVARSPRKLSGSKPVRLLRVKK